MNEPLTRQQQDQAIASFRDSIPRLWFGVFSGCKDAGFTDEQAMRLTMVHIATVANSPIIVHGGIQ